MYLPCTRAGETAHHEARVWALATVIIFLVSLWISNIAILLGDELRDTRKLSDPEKRRVEHAERTWARPWIQNAEVLPQRSAHNRYGGVVAKASKRKGQRRQGIGHLGGHRARPGGAGPRRARKADARCAGRGGIRGGNRRQVIAETLIRALTDGYRFEEPGDVETLERLGRDTSGNVLLDLMRARQTEPGDALRLGLVILAALADLARTDAGSVLSEIAG